MFRKKIKKFTAVFLTLTSLILVNLSLFSVGAHANAVDTIFYQSRTLGAPITVQCGSYHDGDYTSILLNRPNVYYFDTELYDSPQWVGGYNSTDLYTIDYSALHTSDADLYFNFTYDITNLIFSTDSPIISYSFGDLEDHFSLAFGIFRPYAPDDDDAYYFGSITVVYRYEFLVGSLSDGVFSLTPYIVESDIIVPVSNYYAYFPLFNRSILTDEVLAAAAGFIGTNDTHYFILTSASVYPGCWSESFYIDPVYTYSNQPLTEYTSRLSDRFDIIYEADSYEEIVIFDNLSWTDWLVNAIGSFMDFQILPGLSFAGILALLIGMSLFIVFLKVFAGG